MSRETAFQMATGKAAPPPTVPKINEPLPVDKTDEEKLEASNGLEVVEPAVEPKDELQSSRLAIFAKKEAAIQKEREALKKEREEYLKDKAEADGIRKRASDFEDLRKKDPIAALKQIGMTETEIVNFLNSDGKNLSAEEIAAKTAKDETQKLRAELAEEKSKAEKDNNERLIRNLKSDLTSGIKANAEKFEYCAFEGDAAIDQAYKFITTVLKDEGTLLSPDEALEMTETLYEERAKAFAKLKKMQPKEEPTPPIPPTATGRSRIPTSNVPQPKPVTAKAPAIPPAPAGYSESRAEKRERLIKAIQVGGLTR